ncbi:hypothetical protein SH601_00140 [Gracilibacillus sp. S3-1-1]|uniref:Uncharacterized protein n=1 Tax=Gracilibacillus pellucidus TaxID=3095368 RepID=A0ACC6M0B2_9BACI|nr:hypothetical protein [Gracilibacillus sp. S3-1-1]MDX8044381.1 hypothetical protein [Gracilibacillus sp. S3-1-1]
MDVMVNNKQITLFKGATLKHALLKTDEQLYKKVLNNQAVIKDQEGNLTDINGAVAEGWSYYVEKQEK